MYKLILFIALIISAGCSADGASQDVDQGFDFGHSADLGADTDTPDLAAQDMGADAADAATDMTSYPDKAEDYCEGTVEIFCDYYMRCGRMAAADMDECRSTFLETCNAVYEPVYAAYEGAEMLELSPEGIATCAAHLESVECSTQLFDLDGPCAAVWVGKASVGEPCAPGIGSFVCDATTVCKLDLSFCGTCEAAVGLGETCDETTRCQDTLTCSDGKCIARGKPGGACDSSTGCITGSYCSDSLCSGRTMAKVGETCDQAMRCPYKSACMGGVCVESALLGESCVDRACASGYCDTQICQPLRGYQQGCSENFQCAGGECDGPICGELVSSCVR